MTSNLVKFEYDERKRMARVTGDHFDEIREHFSVHNDAAKYARYKNRFIPSRRYVITPQGRFDPGLFMRSESSYVRTPQTPKYT